MLLAAKLVIFVLAVISQSKVVALDRWGAKWNLQDTVQDTAMVTIEWIGHGGGKDWIVQ